MDIAGVVAAFETELSVTDLLVPEFSPKPIATAASPAVTHMTACPCEIGVANFKAGNRGRCVSYFTLRIIVILMETIKDLYYQPACLNPFFNCAAHALG